MSVIFFLLSSVFAQDQLDSGTRKEDERLKDLIWVKDTSFGIFKSKRFANMKFIYPSFSTYRKFIDTSAAGSQSDVTQFAMYNSFWNRLRLQFNKMHKKAYKAGIEWEDTKLDSFHIDSGGENGQGFAYVQWIVKHKGRKRYIISALYLNMQGKWYLMDELKFVGLLPEKKKKKKK